MPERSTPGLSPRVKPSSAVPFSRFRRCQDLGASAVTPMLFGFVLDLAGAAGARPPGSPLSRCRQPSARPGRSFTSGAVPKPDRRSCRDQTEPIAVCRGSGCAYRRRQNCSLPGSQLRSSRGSQFPRCSLKLAFCHDFQPKRLNLLAKGAFALGSLAIQSWNDRNRFDYRRCRLYRLALRGIAAPPRLSSSRARQSRRRRSMGLNADLPPISISESNWSSATSARHDSREACARRSRRCYSSRRPVGVGQSMYQVADYTDVNSRGTAVLLEAMVERASVSILSACRRFEHQRLWRRALPNERGWESGSNRRANASAPPGGSVGTD